jgi:site-specific recombinase XerD
MTSDGKQFKADFITKSFKKHVRIGGFDESLTFHCLRKSHASWLIGKGANAAVIHALLGHAHIAL